MDNFEALTSRDSKAILVGSAAGDLVVEGYAVRWGTVDRENELFREGSLTRAVKSFLSGPTPLLFGHSPSAQLGRVTDLEVRPEGLWFSAQVAEVPQSSPLRHVYELIRRNMVAGVSIGGKFRRALGRDGRQHITDVDLYEISLSGVPMDPSTTASVVTILEDGTLTRKALEDEFVTGAHHYLDLIELQMTVAEALSGSAARRYGRR